MKSISTALSLTIAIAISIMMMGCLAQTQWSQNLAPIGIATNPAFNDENVYTEGETAPMQEELDAEKMAELDKYTQATIEWREPQEISKVVIKATKPIVQFDVEIYTDEGWKKVKHVEYNRRQICTVTFPTVKTSKLRIRIPRAYRVRGKEAETINLARGTRAQQGGGAEPRQGIRKIAEIEVYKKIEPPKEQSE
jgi:hypothetical protein